MPSVKDIVVRKPNSAEVEEFKSWPIWSSDVSEFDWDYTQTETCLLIEGEVTVFDRPATDESISFGVGDVVVFPAGLSCIWKITKAVKKHYDFK